MLSFWPTRRLRANTHKENAHDKLLVDRRHMFGTADVDNDGRININKSGLPTLVMMKALIPMILATTDQSVGLNFWRTRSLLHWMLTALTESVLVEKNGLLIFGTTTRSMRMTLVTMEL